MKTFPDLLFDKFCSVVAAWPQEKRSEVFCLWFGITGDCGGSDAQGNPVLFHHIVALLHSMNYDAATNKNKRTIKRHVESPLTEVPQTTWMQEPKRDELEAQEHWLSLHRSPDHDPHWRPTVLACEQVIARMHESGFIRQMFGRTLPVLIFDDEGVVDEEASLRCNPERALDEFLGWNAAS